MYFILVLEKWKIVLLLIFLPIYSATVSREYIRKVRPNYYALQQRSSLQQIHIHNRTHQQIHKPPVILVRDVSNKIGTPPPSNNLSLFQILGITDVQREIDFVLTEVLTRVLSLLQGVVSVFRGEALNNSPIERQVILGSSGLGVLAAVGVGFVSYF